MVEMLLAWIGVGLYIACVFGAAAARMRAEECRQSQRTPEKSPTTLRA